MIQHESRVVEIKMCECLSSAGESKDSGVPVTGCWGGEVMGRLTLAQEPSSGDP
jgi:hypothetical protein